MSEKLKKQSVIISLIWAFVGTIGVVYYIKIGTGMDVSPNYANNIIYYFIYAASAFSVYYCCKVITKKKAVFSRNSFVIICMYLYYRCSDRVFKSN